MARRRNESWNLPEQMTWELVPIAVLMDIRDELVAVRTALQPLQHLNCSNFLTIPRTLNRIAKNTTKKRRRKAGK